MNIFDHDNEDPNHKVNNARTQTMTPIPPPPSNRTTIDMVGLLQRTYLGVFLFLTVMAALVFWAWKVDVNTDAALESQRIIQCTEWAMTTDNNPAQCMTPDTGSRDS